MARTVEEIVAHIQGSAKSNPKSYSKEYEKLKGKLAAQEAKAQKTTSAEKKQNIQFKRETAEFEKVTDVPTQSEIFEAQAKRIRDLYSQQKRQDLQRRKDEQEWAKVEVDSAQLKKEQAEKALADFEENNDFDWTDTNARKRYDSEIERRQAAVDRANEEIRQRDEAEVTNADVQELATWSDEDKALLDDYISKRQSAFVQSLNPAASGLPADFESNPLIAKYGRQRLDEIASTYQRQRNQEKYQAAEQAGKDAADKYWFEGNVASVGANLADTLLDPLARIAQGAGGRDVRYGSLDPYAGGQARAFASGVRQETAQNIEGEDPTLLSKGLSIGYPLIWINWDYIRDCYHGQAMVTGLLANQKFINKMFALVGISLLTTAFPKVIYDRNRITRWDGSVGTAVGVQGNVDQVAKVLDGASISPQIAQFIELSFDKTHSLLGASDVAMGDSRPDNTSAIIALQRAANTPMELTKQNDHQCLEDAGRIFIDIMSVRYGTRMVEMSMDMDRAGEQPLGMNLPMQSFTQPFDFSTLKDIPLTIEQEVGASSYWSEMASMQTLDNLLMNHLITPEQYIERLPNGYINKKQELLADFRAAAAAAAQTQPVADDGTNTSVETTSEEIPVQGGSGNGSLQRALNAEGA